MIAGWAGGSPFLLSCQATGQSGVPEGPGTMAATAFEKWISKTREQVEGRKERPVFCDAIVTRLQSGKDTTDDTVLACVGAWTFYEETRSPDANGSRSGVPLSYEGTMNFIGSVMPLLIARPFLKGRLLERKGAILINGGDLKSAVAEYTAAMKILTPLHVDVDKERIGVVVSLADSLFSLGDRDKAEELYLSALTYPWHLIEENPEALQALRSLYIRAGHGLINTRRHDLGALRDTHFVPATEEELGPVLEQAILEAEQANSKANSQEEPSP